MYDLMVLQLRTSNAATSGVESKSRGWQWPPFYTCGIRAAGGYDVEREGRRSRLSEMGDHTLPVAHQHASLASSITTLNPFALSSSARYLAAEAPVMPEPTMTTSASEGKSVVVRWPRRNLEGSLCQNEDVDSVVGKLAMFRQACSTGYAAS